MSCRIESRETISGDSSNLPDSIFSISSKSLIKSSSRCPLRSAIMVNSTTSFSKSPRTPEFMSCSEPMIEVSGVRSSWLSVDVNSFFRRSASSSWVISRPWAMMEITSPSSFTSGVKVNSHMISRPSRRTQRNLSRVAGLAPETKSRHHESFTPNSSTGKSICSPFLPISSPIA